MSRLERQTHFVWKLLPDLESLSALASGKHTLFAWAGKLLRYVTYCGNLAGCGRVKSAYA